MHIGSIKGRACALCKTQDTIPNKIHRKHTPVEHTNALKSELNRNQDAMNICETYRICCCWLKFGHIFDAPMRDSKFQVHRSSVMCFCDKSFVILICAIVVYVHILEFQQRDFSVWNFIRTLFLFDFEIETYILARFIVCRLCKSIQNWMSNLCSSQVIITIFHFENGIFVQKFTTFSQHCYVKFCATAK